MCKRESQKGMYKSNELVMQCIYDTVVLCKQVWPVLLGVSAMEKSMSYIYILLLYIYVTSPQVLRVMNRSDSVFNKIA